MREHSLHLDEIGANACRHVLWSQRKNAQPMDRRPRRASWDGSMAQHASFPQKHARAPQPFCWY